LKTASLQPVTPAGARPPVERVRGRRVYSSQVLDRTMAILGAFGSDSELRLADLSSILKLSKSTVYRLLEAMRLHGVIARDPVSGRYRLGLRLFELGMRAVQSLELPRCAQPALEQLVAQTGETAQLGVLDGSDIIFIARAESPQALRMPSAVGRRTLAYCTGVGKVLLAHLPEEELRAYLSKVALEPRTARTLANPAALERDLRSVRARGYSIDDEEFCVGLRCVAAPIRDHTGAVVAAMSVAGPSTRIRREQLRGIAARVINAASEISRRLGHAEAAAAIRRES
jgi:DNA-binding IclR family transcriptional regulator